MPRGRNVPTHYLAGNEREWTPAHIILLDAETRAEVVGQDELLRLRCWVGCAVDRRETRKRRPAEQWAEGSSQSEVADWVDSVTVGNKATRLFTHNLGFDLTVTRLVEGLADRGWALGQWSLTDRATWLRLRKGERGLTLCDSTTWFPVDLGEVGRRVDTPKLPLPDCDESDELWLERCRSDVRILQRAMLQFMEWWDTAGLGNWSVTGNGCGWNAMRHRSPRRTVLVRKGDDGARVERSAIYGGRRDATSHGPVQGGPFVTLDFEDAYPQLAAQVRLPARRLGAFESLALDEVPDENASIQCLAECEVETANPRYPLRANGVVWYPVGRFKTTLAGPEIADAAARGDLRHIGRGWRYFMDGHLAGWARWVLDLSHGGGGEVPSVARITAKRWGRSVLGRFAQRISETEHIGPALNVGWSSMPGYDMTNECGTQVVDLAGERYLLRRDLDADDCFPAVLAWVESLTRVRLNRMLDELGEDAWVTCNTDGALVRLPGGTRAALEGSDPNYLVRAAVDYYSAFCDRLAPLTWPLVARLKDSYSSAWVAGPQSMELDGRPKYAGMPKAATDDGEGGFQAHLWPGLAWQMEHGNREGFVRPLATYSVPTVTVHRFAMKDGTTLPVTSWQRPDGAPELAPAPMTAGGCWTGHLAESQSRPVAKLLAQL